MIRKEYKDMLSKDMVKVCNACALAYYYNDDYDYYIEFLALVISLGLYNDIWTIINRYTTLDSDEVYTKIGAFDEVDMYNAMKLLIDDGYEEEKVTLIAREQGII